MSIYLNYGNGNDGSVTISSNFNCNTGIAIAGRSYPDAVAYNVSAVGSNTVQTTTTPNGIVAGDEVLLITLQGTDSNYTNVGNYEIFRVQSVVGTTIGFSTSKTKLYGQNGGDTIGSHKVVVQRIPNYVNLTINTGASYKCSAWDGNKYGVVFFKIRGELVNRGTISTAALGYRGGPARLTVTTAFPGWSGESLSPMVALANGHYRNVGGGGGGNKVSGDPSISTIGGTGGYATIGTVLYVESGTTYGGNTLSLLRLGSGGGAGGGRDWDTGKVPGSGGAGGGLIVIMGASIKNYGSITSVGASGNIGSSSTVMHGAPGSGGSILIHAGVIYSYSSSILATGGVGPTNTWNTAAGGTGRIAIYYKSLGNSLTGINPIALYKHRCNPSVFNCWYNYRSRRYICI